MSVSNDVDKHSCDVIALKNKDEEKQPLIKANCSINKPSEDISPFATSGDEGDDEEDGNESDLFRFATSSQIANVLIGLNFQTLILTNFLLIIV
jgi:hypothetical protein